MQFVRNGPDIPERLLQAHEDGRVVFFCGAGISYPARLPGFSGLVTRLYEALAETPDQVQQSAIKAGQFDTAIGLLEASVVGGRGTVRSELAKILKPDLTAPNATATHEALLTLAQNREGRTRLITTNFDRLFEEVRKTQSQSLLDFKAPLLPVPKTRWDGLVYLHGLISETATPTDLDRLVVSSGDFGLAYLTERWAARFVSELFRNFTVCFVGYSINDPVLRYMMDALAADRLLGESPPEMFAFGSYSKNQEEARRSEWKAKNVTPILYREHQRHAYLHKTLREWAGTYRDGISGKERIVVECAIARPLASTKQDDFVGRMLWALSDPGGLPAKQFAKLDPVPSIDWLEPLSEQLYSHADLGRFGVPAETTLDDTLTYSLINRPTPYPLAPRMMVVDAGYRSAGWDPVMCQLASWLLRHLDDPKLWHWLIKHGGQLHDRFATMIEQRLNELDKLSNSNAMELDRIRMSAPNAIPRPAMRKLWRLLLNGHVKPHQSLLSLYRWRDQFQRDGLTASVRLVLRKILTPCLSFYEQYNWGGEDQDALAQDDIAGIVGWEVVLTTDHIHSQLRDMSKNEHWIAALPQLLNDFSTLLGDALDLMRHLGGASDEHDLSFIHQPSISGHEQNNRSYAWTALIELTRDAWLSVAMKSPERARAVAETWTHGGYPVFRRLALFAASREGIVPYRQGLDWLLMDGQRWLWSEQTLREAIRLMVSFASRLDEAMLTELEHAILAGPPLDMFKGDIEPDRLSYIVDLSVWLRLAKLVQGGAVLSQAGQSRIEALSAQNRWKLAADERDEFPFWTGKVQVSDRDPWKKFEPIPRTRRGVLSYLLAHPDLEDSKQDDWRKLCEEMSLATAYALRKLAQKGTWPQDRWRKALQVWSEEKFHDCSWRLMGGVVALAPDALVESLSHNISGWLRSVAKTVANYDASTFLSLAQRILQLNRNGEIDDADVDDTVFSSINHPVGHVTQALLDWWYCSAPDDGQGLPASIKPIFTELCDTRVDIFRYGRVLLAANALSLFRVDKVWTEEHVLKLFDWKHSEIEAQAAWKGFLWSPRLYRPLMEAIKPYLLETVHHYAQLGRHRENFAVFLTFAALDPSDTFTTAELTIAIRALPVDGLRKSAQALVQGLEGAGEQREEYWKNRILPFWKNIWPKSQELVSSTIAEPLALLCIAAKKEFPAAVTAIGGWLREIKDLDYVIIRLNESDLCSHFPNATLQFLSVIVGQNPAWVPLDLQKCLSDIVQGEEGLHHDHRWRKLDEISKSRN